MKRLAHYSQYFLRSPQLIKELVGHTSLKKSDTVYDIGAGSGVISSVLAVKCKAVVAVEVEPRAAQKLRQNMAKYPNVTVLERNFLTMPLPTEPYKIFANIPFHLSSPIVRKLVFAASPPDAIYLIVQKQFAHKIVPSPERFTGQLGIQTGPLFEARIRKRLQRTDFWPHPNVDTVLLELKRRDTPLLSAEDMDDYCDFVERCFADPRVFAKTPRHSLRIATDSKPSQLSLEEWVALYKASR